MNQRFKIENICILRKTVNIKFDLLTKRTKKAITSVLKDYNVGIYFGKDSYIEVKVGLRYPNGLGNCEGRLTDIQNPGGIYTLLKIKGKDSTEYYSIGSSCYKDIKTHILLSDRARTLLNDIEESKSIPNRLEALLLQK